MVSNTRNDILILLFFGILFFLSTTILSFHIGAFNSPDEAANGFFAKTYARTGQLFSSEPLNGSLDDGLFPRSVVAYNGRLLPISFLGLPFFYGNLARLLGTAILPYLTPCIAVLAVFAWYGIIRVLFSRRIALLSSLILLFHPAWWYYASRVMMHNVLFVSCLLFAVFFIVVGPCRRWKWNQRTIPLLIDMVLAGIFFAASLWVRGSELPWILLIHFIVLIPFWRRFPWKAVMAYGLTIIIALIPLLFLNQSLYGHSFTTGYTLHPDSVIAATDTISSAQSSLVVSPLSSSFSLHSSLKKAYHLLFPFGIDQSSIVRHFHAYGLNLFWWFTSLVIAGLAVFLIKKGRLGKDRCLIWIYTVICLTITAWLVIFYGSWTFHDNPDPSAITIGNSYIRYWLPAFILWTPIAALGLDGIVSLFRFGRIQRTVRILLVIGLVFLGGWATFFGSVDALYPTRLRLQAADTIRRDVFARTETEAIIIVDRADKLFFPDRRVRYPLRDETTYALMPKMVDLVPVYYYGITLPEKDVAYLNGEKLKGMNLRIEKIQTYGEESLYRIQKNPL